jgi:hypothetical protein
MIYDELLDRIDALESKLMDANVDMNIKDQHIRQLENDLAAARAQIREYEVGTQTMRTLALVDEVEENFDPRESGVFHTDSWRGVR